jgi:AcrR family transcriptional regulator
VSKKQKKLDPRVVRTRQLLRDAMVLLIGEKGFDAITVQDIAERAGVNRATFYLHYKDKNDLLIKSLRDALGELIADITPPAPGEISPGDNAMEPILQVVNHVARHADFYRVMLGADGVPSFIARVRDYIEEITLKWFAVLQPDAAKIVVPVEIIVNYLSGAYIGVIIWWLDHNRPHSPEYMANQLRHLTTLGLSAALGLNMPGAE